MSKLGKRIAPNDIVAPVRIGIQLPEVERLVRWGEVVAIARSAEESGFDSIWVGDHLLYRGAGSPDRGPWDAWTQLGALAAATRRVTLGPLVAATPFHAPGIVARMAASIDEVSGGRFVLGLGAGWNEPEFRAFGFPFDRLASRFEESFEVIRRLLAHERISFSGRFVTVDDAVVLPRPARRIPLMVGSNGERMLGVTLPHVDAWNTWFTSYGNTTEGFAGLNAQVSATCRRVGREPGEVARSACVLVAGGRGGERAHDVAPVPAARLVRHLGELAEAGADEAILVVDPITERSVRHLGALLAPSRS